MGVATRLARRVVRPFLLFVVLIGGFLCLSLYVRDASVPVADLPQEMGREKPLPEAPCRDVPQVSLLAVGDVSYSRAVGRAVRRKGDIFYPFLKIEELFWDADLVFGNLETPITLGEEIPDFSMRFRSNPGTERALKRAGFSVVSLANNHTPDFGESGIKDTFRYLERAGVRYVGAGETDQEAYQPVYQEVNGIRFAFLAYTDGGLVSASYEAGEERAGVAFMREEKLVSALDEARERADIVIVSLHAGTEYVNEPNDIQTKFAHLAIDHGANLVIGHHPHVIQSLESYRGGYIFYSLGNFVFDQPQSWETREAIALKILFSKGGVAKIYPIPVAMKNFAQPEVVSGERAKEILTRLNFPLPSQPSFVWGGERVSFRKDSWRAVPLRERDSPASAVCFRRVRADLDGNLLSEEYLLRDGRLFVYEGDSSERKFLWQSPPEWRVDDFSLADVNNDGTIDLNLSVWKAGSFGSAKPFWVIEDDMGVKNHFFVLDLVDGSMRWVWGSSSLPSPNCWFGVADFDGDGKNDLLVIEGKYSPEGECRGKYFAVWKWNEWGFFNWWRSDSGNFSGFDVTPLGRGRGVAVIAGSP